VIAAERGMALPLALLALVVIAALVAGSFVGALLEQRLGRSTLYTVQAGAAAEAGAANVIGGWAGHGLDALAPGDSAVLPAVALPGGAAYAPTVSRLNGQLFLVRVEGTRNAADGRVLAQRAIGVIVRQADSAIPGALPVEPLANRAWTWMAP